MADIATLTGHTSDAATYAQMKTLVIVGTASVCREALGKLP